MFILQQTTHRMTIRHDPRIGHLWVPNQTARIPHERGGYLVRTNGQGFRSDQEFVAEKGMSRTAPSGCSARRLRAGLEGRGWTGYGE